ncbi:MAG: sodium:solute symporter [Phycisphaera sp.]|nr:MAG: sodium:solute symporter [Phycisphaera sp.]
MPLSYITTANGLLAFDWAVLGAYFALIVISGIWFARKKQRSTDDYFKGSSKLPSWAVAVSIVATSLSAATFLGVPESSYTGDLTYLSTNLGMILAALVIAFLFIPVFYRHNVGSIYELLDHRYGPGASKAASAAFLLGRLLASGARLYLIAIPLTLILYGTETELSLASVGTSVAVVTFVGILYTLIGGITSVIWTDVVQYCVLVGAGIAAVILVVSRLDVPMHEIFDTLAKGSNGASKLRVINTGLDPKLPFTLGTALIGFTVLGIGSYGTDQDLAQRMLTCKNARAGSRSVITGILLGIPTVAVFLLVGLALWIYYQHPDFLDRPPTQLASDDSRKTFLVFIMSEMPAGMTGLMIAGLFAAGLSSVNSAMNAMSAAFINDFYRPALPDKPPEHYVHAGRIGVVLFGTLLGMFALLCVIWQRADREHQESSELLNFALGVMAFAYAGLVPVFLTAILTKRGTTLSIIAALISGFVITGLMQPAAYADSVHEQQTGLQGLFSDLLSLHFTWRLCIAAGISFAIAAWPSGAKRDA